MKGDDQKWLKLFRYLDERFGEVDSRFTNLETKFDAFRGSVDGLTKRVADDDVERFAMNYQLSRHDR